MIRDFFEAIRFLTVLPLPGKGKGDLARAMFFFPLVGFLIGILSLAAIQALSLKAHFRIEALGLVTLPLLLTGGLHADGFADFCDGFFGGKTKEEVFRIMRDSRVGVWGVLGAVLLLLWKWELFASLPRRGEAFLFALTASRWSQVVLAYFLPYADPLTLSLSPKGGEGRVRGKGLGESVAKKVKVRELAGATGFFALLVFFYHGMGVLLLLLLLPFLLGVGFFFKMRVGGVTGDLLGAASEATELFVLLASFLIQTGFDTI